jgi:hypothetical protein
LYKFLKTHGSKDISKEDKKQLDVFFTELKNAKSDDERATINKKISNQLDVIAKKSTGGSGFA